LTCAVKTALLNKPNINLLALGRREGSQKKESKPSFEPAISVRFSKFLREAFTEQWCFPTSAFITLLCLTIRLTGMALTCDFPQLLQAYGRLITNALYLGIPIYFTLLPTVVSESLKNPKIDRCEVLTAVLMKSRVFWGDISRDSWKYPAEGGSTLFHTFGNNLLFDK